MDEFELEHELTHVRQWSANGIMYIPRYFQASRAAAAAGKDRYRDNAFEVEAYGAADALRAARARGDGPDSGQPHTAGAAAAVARAAGAANAVIGPGPLVDDGRSKNNPPRVAAQ